MLGEMAPVEFLPVMQLLMAEEMETQPQKAVCYRQVQGAVSLKTPCGRSVQDKFVA